MTVAEIISAAQANGWNRKQIKNACFESKISIAERDQAFAACGFDTAAEAARKQPSPVLLTADVVPAAPLAGNMALKYPANDCLTGLPLAAGTRVTGIKVGGGWDFTAESIGLKDFKKLREAMLFSLDENATDILDHEDFYILEEFGNRYPRVAAMIGVSVPGLI